MTSSLKMVCYKHSLLAVMTRLATCSDSFDVRNIILYCVPCLWEWMCCHFWYDGRFWFHWKRSGYRFHQLLKSSWSQQRALTVALYEWSRLFNQQWFVPTIFSQTQRNVFNPSVGLPALSLRLYGICLLKNTIRFSLSQIISKPRYELKKIFVNQGLHEASSFSPKWQSGK